MPPSPVATTCCTSPRRSVVSRQDANVLIGPARDGTLRVLGVATRAGVKRVGDDVSGRDGPAAARLRIASATKRSGPTPPIRNSTPTGVSKILAERAAWDFMTGSAPPTTLTTILPGAVFGPVLTTDNLGSVQIIQRLLKGSPAGIPAWDSRWWMSAIWRICTSAR